MTRERLMQGLALSAQVYGDVQPRCPGECICLVKDAPSGIEYAVHRDRSDTLTIIFRGTDSASDWRSNFLFKGIPERRACQPCQGQLRQRDAAAGITVFLPIGKGLHHLRRVAPTQEHVLQRQ